MIDKEEIRKEKLEGKDKGVGIILELLLEAIRIDEIAQHGR